MPLLMADSKQLCLCTLFKSLCWCLMSLSFCTGLVKQEGLPISTKCKKKQTLPQVPCLNNSALICFFVPPTFLVEDEQLLKLSFLPIWSVCGTKCQKTNARWSENVESFFFIFLYLLCWWLKAVSLLILVLLTHMVCPKHTTLEHGTPPKCPISTTMHLFTFLYDSSFQVKWILYPWI